VGTGDIGHTTDRKQALLERCDVGHRVVVRRRLDGVQPGQPSLTDLLGELLVLEPDRLVVRADDGTEREVPLAAVVAAKRIPPRPAKYSEMSALELVADACWPAPVRERLGEWFLRAAEGFTNRANSALPIGEPDRPLDAAIDACARWYDERGLPPKITVALPVRRDVAAALVERGWFAQPDVLVQTAPLLATATWMPSTHPLGGGTATQPDAATDAPTVSLLTEPSPEFLEIVAARKEEQSREAPIPNSASARTTSPTSTPSSASTPASPNEHRGTPRWPDGLPESALHVLTAVPAVRFAEVRLADGSLAAIARAAVVREWMHLGLVEVAPPARRRGLARQISAALAAWGQAEGARQAVLQVEEKNTAAVALYASMGFRTHHRYITYRLP
jgi:GNAT superfamily N-acetyltransferase